MSEQTSMMTGTLQGSVTTSDGETYDITNNWVQIPLEKAAEVAHLIGLRYAAEGHPNVDGPFEYVPAEEFSDYEVHADNTTLME